MLKHLRFDFKNSTKYFFGILNILSFVLALISVTKKGELSWYVISSIIVFNSLFLIGSSIFLVVNYLRYKSLTKFEVDELLVDFFNYINNSFNRFSSRIYKINEDYLTELESAGENQDKIDKLNSDYYNKFKDDVQRFFANVLNHSKATLEKYLKCRGFDLSVSLTIKQLNRVIKSDDELTGIKVFSVFRDFQTHEKQEREIGKKEYTINGNSDFIHCIKQNYYLHNDLLTAFKNGNYQNENKNFTDFYDATVVVPIVCHFGDSRKIYGFLACDTKKDKEYFGQEVFDKKIGKMLYACAILLGIYYDNINYVCEELLGESNNFLALNFQKEFAGKSN